MNNNFRITLLYMVIYLLVFILLVEWLKAIIVLTNTGHLEFFCIFIALSFFMYFMKFKWKIVIPVKKIYIAFALIFIYTDLPFFSTEAFFYLVNTLLDSIQSLVLQEWMEVNDAFLTFLFFVLIWMTTYLLNYWIRVRKNVFPFFLLTVLFITILDTFSTYSGKKSIVITMLSGLSILGLSYVLKRLSEKNVQINGRFLLPTLITLSCLIAVSGILAYKLPKVGPSWPDPVSFLVSTSQSATGEKNANGSNGISKVGYGEFDERLGGAFLSDDTPVFYASVPEKQYWRIETKDTYTSKGWIQSEGGPQVTTFDIGVPITTDIVSGVEEKSEVANLDMMQEFDFVMQPYGLSSLHTEEQITLSYNGANQKILTIQDGSKVPLMNYEVSYSEPIYSLKALRGTNRESLSSLTNEYDRYLQLPETLPKRVKDLALSITEDEDSLYEKAKSIERYFSRNDFRYDQKLAAVPKGTTDYVDQFLFDTKIGYCDNFSTSMVVMLRTIGIPARWVKGFAPGEVVGKEDNVPVYEITNNNAHSWVEAYFPTVGWVNFEPTIGFSNGINLDYDLDIQTTETDTLAPPVKEEPKKEKPVKEKVEVPQKFTNAVNDGVEWIVNRKAVLIWLGVALCIFGLIAYRFRHKWMTKLCIHVYRMRKNDWDTFEKMYHRLLKQLSFSGYAKEQGQTLSDYAKQIDSYYGEQDMRNLTDAYEKGFYGGNRQDIDYKTMRESWENLINRLSS